MREDQHLSAFWVVPKRNLFPWRRPLRATRRFRARELWGRRLWFGNPDLKSKTGILKLHMGEKAGEEGGLGEEER